MKAAFLGSVGLVLLASGAQAQTPPIDIAAAKKAFADAQAVSDKDGGRLWGQKLYGKILFVDPDMRYVIANEPDAQGTLHAQDGVYVGTLPKDVIVSNAPTEWEGARWTQLMWFTVPDNRIDRSITFAHEMFHRIQPGLNLMAEDTPCLHLDTEDGRVWLQLEWRALAAALIETGPAQTTAIRDALAFRAYRQAKFPGAQKAEASQEIAEGVPEFTGVMAGEPDVQAARWHAAGKLAHPDTTVSFVRYFAYISGPGYGLLLDERMPGWRKHLTAQSDLGAMLASTLKGDVKVSAEDRAAIYGASEIRAMEADRTAKEEAEKAHYRALLVDGPTLTTPEPGRFSFNPSTLISLGDGYTVYPTFHAIAKWGVLDVKDGVRVPTDFGSTTLAAPKDIKGPHIEGPGWTIDLAPGWSVVPAAKAGSYELKKSQ
ncbi:MAG TPA: hypothetical protein VG867_06510 [Rhizomicrobium sp.]|nr:hypothetical protein [Rhizomicrobium sp.]